MSYDDPIDELLSQTRRSIRSLNGRMNNEAGKVGENYIAMDYISQGYDVKDVSRDKSKHYDLHVTRGSEEYHVEVKAGLTSDLSPAERARQARDPKYKVRRSPRFMPSL